MQNWYTKSDFWGTRNQPTNRFQLFFTNETCINENTSLLFYVYLVIKILFFCTFQRALQEGSLELLPSSLLLHKIRINYFRH